MRKICLCLPLLFLLASCGSLSTHDAVVIYDAGAAEHTALPDATPEPQELSRAEVNVPVASDEPLEEAAPTEAPVFLDEPEPSEESIFSDEPEPSDEPLPLDEPKPSEEPIPLEEPGPSEEPVSSDEPSDGFVPGLVSSNSPEPSSPPVPEVPLSTSGLSNDFNGWYYNKNDTHEPPGAQRDIDLSLYSALYLGDTAQKKVYLTFDAGYEYGFTERILDTLKEKRVQATFFIPLYYIKSQPELAARMAADGHVVGNHSARHISFPSLTDEEIAAELNDTASFFAETTGYPMDAFFRPPAGEYSERTLALTRNEGYTTVFWSFAYVDWLTEEQPTPQEAYDKVMTGLHNGAVILLHAVSSANTEALPGIIDAIRAEGYEFGSLYELME